MTMNHNGMKAVSCKDVKKVFGTGDTKVMALRGVDLDIYSGELLMLVGPSGCGKTTLISVISGILDLNDGECKLFDQDLSKFSKKDLTAFRRENIGFVFQAFNLVPSLTVAENISIPLLINGENQGKAIERAVACLEQVELKGRAQSLPSQLSGGQQQRVAIARALVHNPKLVVCDEPTSALDHRTGELIMDVLKDLAVSSDRVLVIVTHDARIFKFADRIAYMDDGRIDKIEKQIDCKRI
jgi:putative ABC transport system ATP-binding protein